MRCAALLGSVLITALAGCPTTTPGRYGAPAPDAGPGKSDNGDDDSPPPPGGGTSAYLAGVSIVIDRDELEVNEEVQVHAQAFDVNAQEMDFPPGVELAWSAAPEGYLEITPGSPPTATITALASGPVTLTVAVQEFTSDKSLTVAEVVDPPDDGPRYSYPNEDCSDYAVDGKDVWACGLMESGQPWIQVCRNNTWLNYNSAINMDDCEACGYDGQVTDPGAIYDAPGCPYYDPS